MLFHFCFLAIYIHYVLDRWAMTRITLLGPSEERMVMWPLLFLRHSAHLSLNYSLRISRQAPGAVSDPEKGETCANCSCNLYVARLFRRRVPKVFKVHNKAAALDELLEVITLSSCTMLGLVLGDRCQQKKFELCIFLYLWSPMPFLTFQH